MAQERGRRRIREGVVLSNRMDKTVVVRVERTTRHPLYGRVLRRGSTVKAHDERNECNAGDTVLIMECRPLSKQKRWRVSEILARAK
ncbi:MAG: 30S ribosomal protein S17 [Armatimonadota bacterium]|jgi:small subunit ribosomal protein S17